MTLPRRFQDWPTRMGAFFRDAAARQFAWGTWDCCLYTLMHVDAITGSALAAQFAGRYSDEAGATDILNGLGGPEAAATALCGPPLSYVQTAQRGDVALFDSGQGPAFGVVDLTGTHVAVIADGRPGLALLRLSRPEILKAWRI